MTEARHLADTSHSEEHRHDVEEHAYTHDHDHGNPVISRCWQWITVIGNLASGVGELKTGNISTLVASADGVHNVGDMITYYMQAENILDQNMSEQKRQRMRKVAHWIIATTSVGVGAKAGMDWGNEHTTDPATIYWAGASLAFSGLMLTRLRQGIRRKRTKGEETVHEKDLEKHFWKVDIPSAACAVAGTALQKYNVHTEQILAMMSAGIATWAFRPTKKNLNHDCLGGLFGDAQAASQPDATEEAPDSRHWANGLRRLWDRKETTGLKRRTKLGMCAAGLALGSGLIVGDTLIDARPKVPRGTLALATPSQPVRKTPPPATSPPITTYSVKLRSGDSQWHLVEERLRSATGREPSATMINTITMFTAIENKKAIPRPDAMQPGRTMRLPTVAATRLLYETLHRPETADRQLLADLETLNTQANIEAVLEKGSEYRRITRHLQAALAGDLP